MSACVCIGVHVWSTMLQHVRCLLVCGYIGVHVQPLEALGLELQVLGSNVVLGL